MYFDVILNVKLQHTPGCFGRLTTEIGKEGGLIGDVSTSMIGEEYVHRTLSVQVNDQAHLKRLIKRVKSLRGIELISVEDKIFKSHQNGKIGMKSTVRLNSLSDLRDIYTPGVARVCTAIKKDPKNAVKYTNIQNSVAIVTNGSAVLGLGDIGPVSGMPVMEGKSVFYDKFVGISATPILIDSKDTQEIIKTVCSIAPTFGAIHLEDIKAPQCFYVEAGLKKRLDKPVMHDDQYGTAVVVLASLINACKYQRKNIKAASIGLLGLGAAGIGIATLLISYGVKDLKGFDISENALIRLMRRGGKKSTMKEVMKCDIVIATTGKKNIIKPNMIKEGQIIFALSNPESEIDPKKAMDAGARYAADGKSINNILAYPGVFKGALLSKSKEINTQMLFAAAKALAKLAVKPELLPNALDVSVHSAVSEAVQVAAIKSKVAQNRKVVSIDDIS